jgi:hypothetical protein
MLLILPKVFAQYFCNYQMAWQSGYYFRDRNTIFATTGGNMPQLVRSDVKTEI